MTKSDRAELYKKFLLEEGYLPQIDESGDIVFKHDGRVYFLLIDEGDEEFFRLVFPNFWRIESDAERARAQEAACQATAETKVAKVFIVNDNVWASIEMFCATPEAVLPVFSRALRATMSSVSVFVESMRS